MTALEGPARSSSDALLMEWTLCRVVVRCMVVDDFGIAFLIILAPKDPATTIGFGNPPKPLCIISRSVFVLGIEGALLKEASDWRRVAVLAVRVARKRRPSSEPRRGSRNSTVPERGGMRPPPSTWCAVNRGSAGRLSPC